MGKKKKKGKAGETPPPSPAGSVASPGQGVSPRKTPSQSPATMWAADGVAHMLLAETPARPVHAAGWRDSAAFMSPRTMEKAGFPLSTYIAVHVVHRGPVLLSPTCHLDSPSLKTLGTQGPPTEGAQVRQKLVGCFAVWPSNELKSRQLVLPRSVPVGPLKDLLPDTAVVVDRINPVPAVGVTVRVDNAASVTQTSMRRKDGEDLRLVSEIFEGRCIALGSTVLSTRMGVALSATVVGADSQEANGVVSQYFLITPTTEFRLQQSNTSVGGSPNAAVQANAEITAYDAIGGLGPQLETIRDLIELPLRRPHLFAHFGVRPPGGVLLVGPPGTGKTLIARACASASGAHTIVVNGPEIISKFYGETERRLRDIFAEAHQRAPALIFIDEVDSLCPSRDRAPNDLEKRIVATILTLMDGANTQPTSRGGHVLVIGATNRPDALDPAVRRPGRFDREIEVGIPNATGRQEILDALLRNTPHTVPVSVLASVASRTHGYVGADLAAVCNEAGMLAARRAIEGGDALNDTRAAASAHIDETDLLSGLRRVRPSAMREVQVDVPTIRWSDIGGQDRAKQELCEAVEWPLKHPEAFERMGIRAPRGILLYGPPGCSKTLMAKALATESSLNFLAVKGPEVFSKWVGESEKAVQAVFRKARAVAPSIVFFDEIDAIAGQRQEDGGGGVGDRVLSQLLSEMDGVEALRNVTVVAATNRPDMIDSALLRPGRMDRLVYVGPPDGPAREQILRKNLRDAPCGSTVDVPALAAATDGCSGAEVVAVCREGALLAMKEDPVNAAVIEQHHYLSAVAGLNRTITPEMLTFYDRYRAALR